MSRVVLFAAGLAGAFLAALAVGNALDLRDRRIVEPAHEEAEAGEAAPHGGEYPAERAEAAGLAVEQDGYRLVHEADFLEAGREQDYVFRILGPDGSPLREYEVENERRLHLIVVARRPDGAFLHLHPRQRPDGAWTVPLKLPAEGAYRVFADFTTAGERRTLGIDLDGRGGPSVTGDRLSRYLVTFDGHGDELRFGVRDAEGRGVELEPYLGALGHLVVLREGDLAYVHAHADEDELAFDVPFPSEGRYRLYLQFKVRGGVETVSRVVER